MSLLKELNEAASKRLKVGGHVTINGVKTSNPDHEGRIDKIDKDFVYITNMNMPFVGSYSMKKFKKTDVTAQ
jgi:hypothetical protein